MYHARHVTKHRAIKQAAFIISLPVNRRFIGRDETFGKMELREKVEERSQQLFVFLRPRFFFRLIPNEIGGFLIKEILTFYDL